MRQILVAVDVSPLGPSVLEEAAPLTRRLGGAVHILHICSIDSYAGRRDPADLAFDQYIDQRRAQVRDWAGAAGFAGMRHHIEVIPGDSPAEGILTVADHIDADLIVMGSHSTASKHAILGMTTVAALEYSGQGIRVNAICPAFIKTPMLERGIGQLPNAQEMWNQMAGLHPVGRIGEADEVARLVLFRASDQASFISGAAHLVGRWLHGSLSRMRHPSPAKHGLRRPVKPETA